jgi:hypothetical protein
MYRIQFEDQRQDALSWDVDSEGTVVDSQPFKARTWIDHVVIQPELLQAGDLLEYICKDTGETRHFRFPIQRIERFSI